VIARITGSHTHPRPPTRSRSSKSGTLPAPRTLTEAYGTLSPTVVDHRHQPFGGPVKKLLVLLVLVVIGVAVAKKLREAT
jgi:hypothetical protein